MLSKRLDSSKACATTHMKDHSKGRNMSKLTHLDQSGNARMVDISDKRGSKRIAIAKGSITMPPSTLDLILDGGIPKGDVLATARIAGILAAKKTSELIPLCHPIALASISVEFDCDRKTGRIVITAEAVIQDKTGVEMEALTAVSVAALTLYDMCKAVEKGMTISDIRLVYKQGGKSGIYGEGPGRQISGHEVSS
jgi:cyclic pyranopterin monophosphate synthase